MPIVRTRHRFGHVLMTDEVAMGSSLGSISGNLFTCMAHFEKVAKQKATASGFTFPDFWIRYVDDMLIYWKHLLEELDSYDHFEWLEPQHNLFG